MDAPRTENDLLLEALQRLGAYHFQTRLDAGDFPTMGPLADAFNTMADSIEAFVSNDVTRRVTWSERDRLTCMSQLTAGIAHEIRNPLEAIVNSIALLVRNNLSPREKQELSGIVSDECTRLQRIFRHFIQFSRFPIARMEATDIGEAIHKLYTLLSTNNPESVDFVLESGAEGVMVLCDADLIHQALMNLMLNAIEAMPEGGRLAVRVTSDERHVTVCVTDSGEGIPAERLEQIMEPFYTSRPTGVGLGLAITQHILAQHGSRLEMSSDPGQGAKASFTLPRARSRG
ncbi:hypothetical protein BI364_00835 [Acidihalobacter yilgarnensis]|uniref:histidine kinase n=1 Tax=Acidihalobacter yilgarnensis TaxID=2819280 RepID=A0A1D8IJU0_9GAMM|nr:ATP-binding protein [Acidihalobacter yilgarnensis]AOU96747.1 hypothetical protein BI364_00835 [Acidihalobacter yilgarnensis]